MDKSDNSTFDDIEGGNESLLANQSLDVNSSDAEAHFSQVHVKDSGLVGKDSSTELDSNSSENGSSKTDVWLDTGSTHVDNKQSYGNSSVELNESLADKSDNSRLDAIEVSNASQVHVEDIDIDGNASSTELDFNGSENVSNQLGAWFDEGRSTDGSENQSIAFNESLTDKSDNSTFDDIEGENQSWLATESLDVNSSDAELPDTNVSEVHVEDAGLEKNDSSTELDSNSSETASNKTDAWLGEGSADVKQEHGSENRSVDFNESVADKSDNSTFDDIEGENQSLLANQSLDVNSSDVELPDANASQVHVEDTGLEKNDSSTEVDSNSSENAFNKTDVWLDEGSADVKQEDGSENRSVDFNESLADKSDNSTFDDIEGENQSLLINQSLDVNSSDAELPETNVSEVHVEDSGLEGNDSSTELDSNSSENASMKVLLSANRSLDVNSSDAELPETNASRVHVEDTGLEKNDSSTELDFNSSENTSNETDAWFDEESTGVEQQDEGSANRSADFNESVADKSDNSTFDDIEGENLSLLINRSLDVNSSDAELPEVHVEDSGLEGNDSSTELDFNSSENVSNETDALFDEGSEDVEQEEDSANRSVDFNESLADKSDNSTFDDIEGGNQSLLANQSLDVNSSDAELPETNVSEVHVEDSGLEGNDSSTELDFNSSENASNETDAWFDEANTDVENQTVDFNDSLADKSDNSTFDDMEGENQSVFANRSLDVNSSDAELPETNASRVHVEDTGLEKNDSSTELDFNSSENTSNETDAWFDEESTGVEQQDEGSANRSADFNESVADKSDNSTFNDIEGENQSLLVNRSFDVNSSGAELPDTNISEVHVKGNDSSSEFDFNSSENTSNETDDWFHEANTDVENQTVDFNDSLVDKSDNSTFDDIEGGNQSLLANQSLDVNSSDAELPETNVSEVHVEDSGLEGNDSSTELDFNSSENASNETDAWFDEANTDVENQTVDFNDSLADKSDNSTFDDIEGENQSVFANRSLDVNSSDAELPETNASRVHVEDTGLEKNDSSTELDFNSSENTSNETDAWFDEESTGVEQQDEGSANRSADFNESVADKSDNSTFNDIEGENQSLLVNRSFDVNSSGAELPDTNISEVHVKGNDSSSEFDFNSSENTSNETDDWFHEANTDVENHAVDFNDSLADKSDNSTFDDMEGENQSVFANRSLDVNSSDAELPETNASRVHVEDTGLEKNDSSTELDFNSSENASNETVVWLDDESTDLEHEDGSENRSVDFNESVADKSQSDNSTFEDIEGGNQSLLANGTLDVNSSDAEFPETNESQAGVEDTGLEKNDSSTSLDFNSSENASNETYFWLDEGSMNVDKEESYENQSVDFNESLVDKSDNSTFDDMEGENQSLLANQSLDVNSSDVELPDTNASQVHVEDTGLEKNDSSTELDFNSSENASNETVVWLDDESTDLEHEDGSENRSVDFNESVADKSQSDNSTFEDIEGGNQSLLANGTLDVNSSDAEFPETNESQAGVEDTGLEKNDSSTSLDFNSSENASNETYFWLDAGSMNVDKEESYENQSVDFNESLVDKSDNSTFDDVEGGNQGLLVNSSFASNSSDGGQPKNNASQVFVDDTEQDVDGSSNNLSFNGSNETESWTASGCNRPRIYFVGFRMFPSSSCQGLELRYWNLGGTWFVVRWNG